MAVVGLRAVAEVFGQEAVDALSGCDAAAAEAQARALQGFVEQAAEVGPRLLLPNSPDPADKRACVRAVGAAAAAVLRHGLPPEAGAHPPAGGLGLMRLLVSHQALTHRAPRDTLSRAVHEAGAAAAHWLPSQRSFEALRQAAAAPHVGPGTVVACIGEAAAAGADAESCAHAVAYLAVAHGVSGDAAPGSSRCPAPALRAAAEALPEAYRGTVTDAAAAAAGGADCGFSARQGRRRSAPDHAATCAAFFGVAPASVAGSSAAPSTAADSEAALEPDPTAEELGFAAGARMSLAMLLRSTMQATRAKGEPLVRFLQRLTHLALGGKGLERVDNLHLCTNLKVVYLDDNRLESLEDGLAPCAATLTHLYAQGNALRTLAGCDTLRRLTKLYLIRNRLESLRGIEALTALEELHASHQEHAPGAGLSLEGEDGGSVFQGLSKLAVLKLADVGLTLEQAGHLTAARGVEDLDISRNEIADAASLGGVLRGLPRLRAICVAENALTKQAKWRDALVLGASDGLRSIDSHEVTARERQFLRDLRRRSGARERFSGPGAAAADEEPPLRRRSSAPGLEVVSAYSAAAAADGPGAAAAGAAPPRARRPSTEGVSLPALPGRALRRASSGQSLGAAPQEQRPPPPGGPKH